MAQSEIVRRDNAYESERSTIEKYARRNQMTHKTAFQKAMQN